MTSSTESVSYLKVDYFQVVMGFLLLELKKKRIGPNTRISGTKIKNNTRSWVELPPDVLSMIFKKLGVGDILLRVQSVCSVWRKLSKQPHLYRTIDLLNPGLYGLYDVEKMAIEAVHRSCGQLVEFSMEYPTDPVLWIITLKCSSLKCLRLNFGDFVSDNIMIEMAKKCPQLEELELCHCPFSTKVIEAFGRSCLQLKSFRLNRRGYKGTPSPDCDKEALAIAKNMPELLHLNIFGNRLSDNGLRAILDGCPHLRSLDLRQCFNVCSLGLRQCLVEGDLRKRCVVGNIISKLPDDSTHGYEFDTSIQTGSVPRCNDEEFYENYYDNSWSENESPYCDDESFTMMFYDYNTL